MVVSLGKQGMSLLDAVKGNLNARTVINATHIDLVVLPGGMTS
jgi:hypothetical protein